MHTQIQYICHVKLNKKNMSEAASSVKTRKELEKENHLLQGRLSEMQKQLDEMDRQNAVQGEQLANLTERHSALESKYDLECLSREDMVEQELQKRMAEERREEREKMDKEWKELERQKADARKELETMLQSACAKVEGEYAEKMEKALHSGITQVVDMLKIGLAVKKAMLEGGGEAAEAELERFQERLPEAKRVLAEELREALEKVEKKGVKQAQHIAELVRMVFTRKSERVKMDEENRETLIESVVKTLELNEEQKKELKNAHRTIREMDVYDYLHNSKGMMNFHSHPIHKVVKLSLQPFFLDFLEKKISIDFGSCKDYVRIDFATVSVVLGHFWNNAVKYCLNDGQIEIGYQTIKDTVVMKVTMTSLLITDEDYERLYEEGYSGYWAKVQKQKGTV